MWSEVGEHVVSELSLFDDYMPQFYGLSMALRHQWFNKAFGINLDMKAKESWHDQITLNRFARRGIAVSSGTLLK